MTRYRDPFEDPYSRERLSSASASAANSKRINAGTNIRDVRSQPLQTSRTGAIATPTAGGLGDRHLVRHDSADYNAGFIQGRAVEHHRLMESQRARDEENTINGLLAGILLTSLIALGIGTAYFLSQRNNTPQTAPSAVQPTTPTVVQPATPASSTTTTPSGASSVSPTTGTQSGGATRTGTP